MTNDAKSKHAKISPDWFVHGALTRLGDTFDRLTGRGKQRARSLATSELIEKLKKLLDEEVETDETGRKFVPHNIKLKMQWDKFSTDSEKAIKKLEYEFLSAVVDHIDERRYYTYAPLSIEIKPDYFISGVKLFASFDKFTGGDRDAEVAVPIQEADAHESGAIAEDGPQSTLSEASINIRFTLRGQKNELNLDLFRGFRCRMGRTKENDVAIDDISVSKHHASLVLNNERRLLAADVGSTNGTFINGNRISYGEAYEIKENDVLRLGDVEVLIQIVPATEEALTENDEKNHILAVGNVEMKRRMEIIEPIDISEASEPGAVESAKTKEPSANNDNKTPPDKTA